MTSIKNFSRIAAAVAVVSVLAVPVFAARGSADFTRFVAIGDSYGAGVSSGSMNERHTPFSWPAVVARQAGAPQFVQPLVSYPGVGNELQLVDVVSYPPRIVPATGSGTPLNTNFAAPFNNLSVPGANVRDVTTITGGEQNPQGTAQMFARFILRGLGTEVQQAIAQRPTFIAIWIGGNDVLGAVLSGTPAALTPVDSFRTSYNAMLDQLTTGAPTAGMIVGNLPTAPAGLPLVNTVAPFIVNPVTRQPIPGPDGNPIFYVADLGGGTIGQLPAGSVVLLTAATKLASGTGIPAAFKNIPPFNQLPNVGTPLADNDVLTPTEIAAIVARATEYNTVIQQAASSRDIPVADINGLFNSFGSGVNIGPFRFTSGFITGGLFSLDGFHMTDIGYSLFANQYIRTINAAYRTEIAVASIANFLENNGAFFPDENNLVIEMSEDAVASILRFATPVKKRLRAAGH